MGYFLSIALTLLGLLAYGFPTFAEDSIRCKSALVQLGDSKLDVLNRCGDPDTKDEEAWTYNLGQGDFVYLLTFKTNRLASIEQKGRGYFDPKKPTMPTRAAPDLKVTEYVAKERFPGAPHIWVKGIVKNVGAATAKRVRVTVRALNPYGNPVEMEQMFPNRHRLAPGEESYFEIPMRNTGSKRYDCKVEWEPET